jgi:arginyl-tRNA synthetase
MLPGDIAAELVAVIQAVVARGDLPAAAAAARAAGTWRPAPGGAPGTYATSLPFRLAGPRCDAPAVARLLAAGLAGRPQIASAQATGAGYLTITVTPAALAQVAVRIAQAGLDCARSDVLAGQVIPAPPAADLAAAATWAQAHRQVAAAAAGRLAQAAGAVMVDSPDMERMDHTSPAARPAPASPAEKAVGFAGRAAITYALARRAASPQDGIDARASVINIRQNPYFAVTFAQQDASATLRRAAGRGLHPADPADATPGRLAAGAERALLGTLSWLPERAASAGRRARPDEFARYLEELAGAYLDVRELCPVVPPGPGGAPDDATARARLWLAAAAAAALTAGLSLLDAGPAPRRGYLCETPG